MVREPFQRFIGLCGCLLFVGCSIEPEINEQATIQCVNTDDCPEGWVCKEDLDGESRCVNASGSSADLDAPTIDSERGVIVTPQQGKHGDVFTVCFSANEPLAETPVVTIDSGLGVRVMAPLDGIPDSCEGQDWAFTFVADQERDQEGSVTIAASLIDLSLNPANAIVVGTVEFDFTAPRLSSYVLSSEKIGIDGRIQIEISTSESTFDIPTVFMESDSDPETRAWEFLSSDTDQFFVFEYEVAGNELEVPYTVHIEKSDGAGNFRETILLEDVTVDFTPPSFSPAMISPEGVLGKGDFIELTFPSDTSDNLDVLPILSVTGDGSGLIAPQFGPGVMTGGGLYFSDTIRYEDCAGTDRTWGLQLFGGTDDANNIMSPLVQDAAFRVDCRDAEIVSSCVYPPDFSFEQSCPNENVARSYTQGDSILIATSFTEEVTASVSLNSFVFDACEESEETDCCMLNEERSGVQCEILVKAEFGDGTLPVILTATDVAENSTSVSLGEVRLDAEPPAVLDARFTPEQASLGSTVFLTIVTNEDIKEDAEGQPLVSLGWSDEKEPGFTFISKSGSSYLYAYQVLASSSQGQYSLESIELTDLAGNTGLAELSLVLEGVPSFEVDTLAPEILNVSINSEKRSKNDGYSAIELAFEINESANAFAGDVQVRFAGRDMVCSVSDNQPANYACNTTVTVDDPDGFQVLSIEARDGAGNLSSHTVTVEIDNTGPQITSLEFTPESARLGNVVTLSIQTDEAIVENAENEPDLQLLWADGSDPGFAFTGFSGTNYLYGLTVSEGTANGVFSLLTVMLQDDVGNHSNTSILESLGEVRGFTVDNDVPQVTNLIVNAQTRSEMEGFNEVVFTFDVSEDVLSIGGALNVDLSGRQMDCTAYSATPPSHTCVTTIDPTDPEGLALISVDVRDGAGNITFQQESLTIDRAPPRLLDMVISNPVAIGGALVLVNIILDEPAALDDEGLPMIQIEWEGDNSSLQLVSELGSSYTYQILAPTTDVDQSYAFTSVAATDRVGNQGVEAQASPLALFVDNTPPAVTSLVLNRAVFSEVDGFNELQASFDVAEDLGANNGELVVSFDTMSGVGWRTLDCSAYQPGSPSYICSTHIEESDGDGFHVLSVETRDAAGNTASAGQTFQVDLTPAMVVDVSFSADKATLGDTVILTAYFDDELAMQDTLEAPELELGWSRQNGIISGPIQQAAVGATFGGFDPSAFQYHFNIPILHDTEEGTYSVYEVISFRDTVGHTSSSLDLASLLGVPPTFEVDMTPPIIDKPFLEYEKRSEVDGYTEILVSFGLEEDLPGQGGNYSVEMNGRLFSCDAPTLPGLVTCSDAVLSRDPDGFQTVLVRAQDSFGNTSVEGLTLEIDRTAPGLVPDSELVWYVAGPNNIRNDVNAATVGTTARLSLFSDEPVSLAPTVEAPTSGMLPFTLTSSASTSFVFEQTIGADTTEGTHTVYVTLTDFVGNTSAPIPLTAPLVVDVSPPDAPETTLPGAVTYERRPWGDESTDGAITSTIALEPSAVSEEQLLVVYSAPAQPYVELGRQTYNPAEGAAVMSLVPNEYASVYIGAVDGAGNMSSLVQVKDMLWVATLGLKMAGSDLENPHFGQAQNTGLEFAKQKNDAINQTNREVTSEWALPDGVRLTTDAGPAWTRKNGAHQVMGSAYLPEDALIQRDGRRGTFLMLLNENVPIREWSWGASAWEPIAVTDPELDGSPPVDPQARMVFDGHRGVMVLFGGPEEPSDVWEFDGVSWARKIPLAAGPNSPANPEMRINHGMAYDPFLKKVLMFGGENANPFDISWYKDLWAWDGQRWEFLSSGPDEAFSDDVKLAVNEVSGSVVVLRTDLVDDAVYLQEWPRFGPVGPGEEPQWDSAVLVPDVNSQKFMLEWDPVREDLIIASVIASAGGVDAPNGPLYLQSWNGQSFTPEASLDLGLFDTLTELQYAPGSDSFYLFFNGQTGNGEVNSFERENTQYEALYPLYADNTLNLTGNQIISTFGPDGVSSHSMVYDARMNEILLFGGEKWYPVTNALGNQGYIRTAQYTFWSWDGKRWKSWFQGASGDPSLPFGGAQTAMVFDSARQQTWLLALGEPEGVTADPITEIWSWDASGIQKENSGGSLEAPEIAHPGHVTYDSARDRIQVLSENYLYEMNPQNKRWSLAASCEDGDPSDPGTGIMFCEISFFAPEYIAIAYHPVLEKTVVFGANRAILDAPDRSETMVWDPATLTWDSLKFWGDEARVSPKELYRPQMHYDPSSGDMLLYGGETRDSGYSEDVWRLDLEARTWSIERISLPSWSSQASPFLSAGSAFNTESGELVIHGRVEDLVIDPYESKSWISETWHAQMAPSRPPAHIFKIEKSEARVPSGATMTGLAAQFVSGGRGYQDQGDSEPLLNPGVFLDVFANQRFHRLAETEASPEAVSPVTFETSDPDEIQRLEFDGAWTFRVMPQAGSVDDAKAQISTDYVELQLNYRLP